MDYLVYEHTIGTPEHVETEMEDLEGMFEEFKFTAEEAERFIKKWIPDVDRYGCRRRVYVYRLKER